MRYKHQSLKFFFLSLNEAKGAPVLMCHLEEISQNLFFSKVSWLLASISDTNFDFITESFLLFFLLNQLLLFLLEAEYHGYSHLITAMNGHSILRLSGIPTECLMVTTSRVGVVESIAPWPCWKQQIRPFFLRSFKPFTSYPTPLTFLLQNFLWEWVNWPFNSFQLLHLENGTDIINLLHNDTLRIKVL